LSLLNVYSEMVRGDTHVSGYSLTNTNRVRTNNHPLLILPSEVLMKRL
jgi:hypothetical protein